MKPGVVQRVFLVVFAAACLSVTAAMTYVVVTRGAPGDEPAAEPLLIPTPAFELTDTTGQLFGSAQLAGGVYVIDFIFTRCRLACPVMTARMKRLQDGLADHPRRDDIRLVSVSVDPEHDTADVLAEYAQNFEADPECWHFLTGDRDAIWTLSEHGFKLPVGDDPGNALMPIGHSSKFVLVDPRGRIFDYYNSNDDADLERLRRDIDRAFEAADERR